MRFWSRLVFVLLMVLTQVSCGEKRIDVNRRGEIKLRGEKPVKMRGKKPGDLLQKGVASWYGHPFHGRKTSNGETYNMNLYTAAHKTIPFDTIVKVVDRDTGKHVFVRINDRGPFIRGRHIDLSRAAARKLGSEGKGIANVKLYLARSKDLDRQTRGRMVAENKPKPKVAKPKPARVKPKPKPMEKPVDSVEHVVYAPDEIIEEEILEPEHIEDEPVVVRGETWSIQVGSFSTNERAEAHAQTMRAYGVPVKVVAAGGFYKVRVGEFASKGAAAGLVEELKGDGHPTWVLRDGT